MHGLTASLRNGDLDVSLTLDKNFATTVDPAGTSFAITGGGAKFQIGSEVNRQGQIDIGIGSVSTTNLGNLIDGFLSSLGSGGDNSLVGGNTVQAQKIIADAITQVATLRGRLGALQKDVLDTNVNSLPGRVGERDQQRKRHSRRRLRLGNGGSDPVADPGAGQHVRSAQRRTRHRRAC